MQHSSEEALFDVRLIARHLEKGVITGTQVEQHLQSLPDVAALAESMDEDDVVDDDAELLQE